MRVSETPVRRDSRLFEELCAALLRRGNSVKFRANGESMSPNIFNDDDVTVAPIESRDLRQGDVVLAQNADGLRVHRVESPSSPSGAPILRSDTGLQPDSAPSQIYGRVIAKSRGQHEEAFHPLQTRLVHPFRIIRRRAVIAAKLSLRRFGLLIGFVAVCLTFVSQAVEAQTADLQLTQTASATAVAPSSSTQSLGTPSSVNWAAGVATFTFPTPLPSGVFVNAPLTTTGFTPAAYNVTGAAITAVNTGTGAVSIAMAAQSMGTATSATWATNVASFTFPTPLPSFAVVGAQLTTTGFTPAPFNVSNYSI